MWRARCALGAIPYYMFVERDTGPRAYFEVPLARAFEIHAEATRMTPAWRAPSAGP